NHQRKATSENKKPKMLDDVFGGQWLTGGLGSVLLLWGQPGDTEVELSHLKPVEIKVGPYMVKHDHKRGYSTKVETEEELIFRLVREAGSRGIIEPALVSAACGVVTSGQEYENARKRIHRRLMNHLGDLVTLTPGQRGGSGGSSPNRWTAKADN